MQFFFSKLVIFLIAPANWIICGLILFLAIRSKRWKKITGIATLSIGLLFTNPWLFRTACLSWQPDRTTLNGKFGAVILPGGLAGYDKNGEGYFGLAADRFIQTVAIYRQGYADKIIVTGGNGLLNRNLLPEADFLYQQLIRQGVPARDILIENKSRNTEQNALFTKQLLDSAGLTPPFVLVTSAMHMRRCAQEFSNAGIRTVIYPSNFEVIRSDLNFLEFFWPDLSIPEKWGRLLKEVLGYCVSRNRQAARSAARSERIMPEQKASQASCKDSSHSGESIFLTVSKSVSVIQES
ncbi:YdcF family protein [Flavihumibacter solisilvae]|uniref:YdcF family protein n=1 Tax=Flavihumibacter solisilvae TaxID=1349421 RepID=UPI00068DCCD3|nr:YdcF family protein [Flavihumibacter solisilvae]